MADNLSIIEEFTGASDYPSTRTLPPIIFVRYGPSNNTIVSIYLMNGLVLIFRLNSSLVEDGIERLRGLDGVDVRVPDDDDSD